MFRMRLASCLTASVLGSVAALAAVYVSTPDRMTTRSGIPLGGLGCGTVEIRGDGGFHEWQIFNNTCSPATVPEALLAARVAVGGQTSACALHLRPPAGLPGVEQVTYRGEFPFAWLSYSLPESPPVEVRLEAFTPFIPHDTDGSSIPGAVLRLHLLNRSTQHARAQFCLFMPAAMRSAGAGEAMSVRRVSTAALTGGLIATAEGEPAKVGRPVRVLLITDNQRERLEQPLARVRGLTVRVVSPGPGGPGLPAKTARELQEKFDVIWLAELGRARDALGPAMAMIRDAVAAGVGFIHSGGWDSFFGFSNDRWAKLTGTPIEEILPVKFLDRFDAVNKGVRTKVVTQLEPFKTAALERFPGAGGYNEVAGVKKGATIVLATTDGKPILVVGKYGKGRTVAYMTTPFGGWPRAWNQWTRFYATMVAYAAGTTFSPASGTPSDDPASGSLFAGCLGARAAVARWSDLSVAWSDFAEDGSVNGPGQGRNIAVVQALQAPPRGRAAATFIFAWCFPNHRNLAGERDGNRYATRFDDAAEAAKYLADNLADLERRTRRFHDALYNSPLPYWLADAINAQLTTMTKSSWWDEQGNFGIWEGMNCCCGLHTVDVSFYGSWPLVMLFPELQKNALRLTAKFQREDGRIPHLFAGGFTRIDNYGRIDLPIQFILPLYREFLYTGDRKLLAELWPAARSAAESVFVLDTNADGLPEHTRPGDQTYDGWAISGESAYIGSIWLAALRALEQMALEMRDTSAAARYHRAFEQARESYEKLLWTGKYYRLWHDPKTGAKDDGLMLDGMCGQWYAHMLGLGDMLPRQRVLSHLRMCIKHNRLPIQRGMAYMVGDTGYCYVNCSWPGGKQPIGGQAGSPWTGTEYAFASLCIYEGLVEEGLQVVRDVYERYREAGMTWNHIECGGHYFRPMDVWTVLMALEGLRWNAPEGKLVIAPARPDQKLRAPVVLPQAWGVLTWDPRKRSASIRWEDTKPPIRQLLTSAQ